MSLPCPFSPHLVLLSPRPHVLVHSPGLLSGVREPRPLHFVASTLIPPPSEWLRHVRQHPTYCDTGTSGQRRSDGNVELVRFLDSHEGDGARAVFAGVRLLYRDNTPHDNPSKFTHR